MKKLSWVLSGLLVIQFILGMLANFYTTVPEGDPAEVFQHLNFISIHSLTAVLLLILALVFAWKAHKNGQYELPAYVGLVSILVAFAAGHIFVGNQSDIWSLIMSLGFVGAFGAYLTAGLKGD